MSGNLPMSSTPVSSSSSDSKEFFNIPQVNGKALCGFFTDLADTECVYQLVKPSCFEFLMLLNYVGCRFFAHSLKLGKFRGFEFIYIGAVCNQIFIY